MKDCKNRPNSLYLVEGDMERLAFREKFKIRASKLGAYGHSVSMEKIAQKICVQLLYSANVKFVFIMFDREQRNQSADELSSSLRKVLEVKFPNIEFCIAIPDRDIESWIFSDKAACESYFGKKIGKSTKSEGTKGTDYASRVIGPGRYDKMTDGPRLIQKISWPIIERSSQSAKAANLSRHFDQCPWVAA